MTLGLWFGQFNIVDGQIQEEGPYVGIFEGGGSAAGVGLYIVTEPVGAASARLCNEVVEIVARTFGNPEQALTANLLRALSAGHQHVRDWNRLHGGDRVAGVGVSCLAMRGDEAYLAQCGSALSIAQTAGRFRVAAPAGDDSRRPLGLGDRAAPVFTRFSLRPGDVILLLFSTADRIVDRGTLISLATSPPEESLPTLYRRVRDAPAFGALYLGVIERPEPVAAGYVPPSTSYGSPAPPPEAAGVAARRAPEWPAEPATAPPASSPNSPVQPNGYAPEQPARGYALSYRPPVNYRAPLGGLGGGARLPSRRILLAVVAIVAIILLLKFAMPALARRGTDDRFQELLHSADRAIASAQQSEDAAGRRTLLNRAQADLLEARQIRPDAGDVGERLTRVETDLVSLDSSRELAGVTTLADLSTSGVGTQSALELVAAGGRLYVLDAAAGKVLAFDAQPGDRAETVFEEGRAIGPEKSGKARHVTLAPEANGRGGTVLVLDANRRLYALTANGSWRSVALPATETWKADTAIAAAAGALYVLDAPGEQLWRYSGSATGYEGPPEPLAARAPLKDGIALSLGGTPVIATSGGRLLRTVDGKEAEIRPAGLDRPLVAPSAPVFNPGDSLLYIADRGNQRIVLLDAQGTFRGQLVHRRFMALRAIALDGERGLLYAVSGQALLSAPLTR